MSTLKKKSFRGTWVPWSTAEFAVTFYGGEMLGARGPYGVEFHDTSSTASLI